MGGIDWGDDAAPAIDWGSAAPDAITTVTDNAASVPDMGASTIDWGEPGGDAVVIGADGAEIQLGGSGQPAGIDWGEAIDWVRDKGKGDK